MNALIDVYLDNNLGDDIMGETLINYLQNKGIKCYLLANDDFTYSNFINKFSGVNIVGELSKNIIKENKIDLYIRIGGSMFPHNTIKEGVFRYLTLYKYKMMKRNGVKIYILGCNVGPFKSSIGVRATKGIIKLSDLITCRDKETLEFISKIKNKDYFIFPDIVFSRKDLRRSVKRENDVLGISMYTGYTSSLRKYNFAYSNMMINIINRYLEIKRNGKVKLFVFDSGYNSDYPTAHRVYNNINDKNRVRIIDYNGNIKDFMDEYNKCSVMIGTRFHSIVLSLLFNIPVLPVIYSNKTRNILNDLNYKGPKIEITNCEDINIDNVIQSICEPSVLLNNVDDKILQDSEGHLNVLSSYLSNNN
jgi:colanic acid/amylovoran biosynthesis protein